MERPRDSVAAMLLLISISPFFLFDPVQILDLNDIVCFTVRFLPEQVWFNLICFIHFRFDPNLSFFQEFQLLILGNFVNAFVRVYDCDYLKRMLELGCSSSLRILDVIVRMFGGIDLVVLPGLWDETIVFIKFVATIVFAQGL